MAVLPGRETSAQTYPTKSIRLVVPFAPGGGGDVLARLVGQKLTESWRYPVVIDNRSGAGGIMGSDLVAKAAPDGYTLVMGTVSTHAVAASFYKRLPYDPAKDFAPITVVADIPNYLVAHPSVPVNSVKELIAFAKARPGQLNYASSGNGSGGHLAMELFKSMAGIQAVHIPFKGAGPGTTAVLAGEVNMQFASVLPLMPHIKSGRLKALAISGEKRSLTLPDVPTVSEFVPGYEATTWFGLLAPGATPAPVVMKIYSEVVRIINVPEFRENLVSQGANPVGNTPAKFSAYIKSEIIKWAKVVKATGAQVD
jgi:tripartite-type tricarboxylate transporter receptor subunit TctC